MRREQMTTYHVYANAAEGYYEAEDEQGARAQGWEDEEL